MSDKLEKFVHLIQKYQCLYNNTLQEYSRKDVTEKAWSSIAKEMQWTVADCKEKWKNIRNGFVRSLKPLATGSSSKGKKPYYLHDTMQFVLPYLRPLQNLEQNDNISLSDTEIIMQNDESEYLCQSTGNFFEINTEIEDISEPTKRTRDRESPCIVVNKKKKKKHLQGRGNHRVQGVLESIREKKDKKPNDYRKMFLLSLLPDVENLSERNLRQFKIKSLILLEQLLTEQDQPTEQYIYDDSHVIHYSTNFDLTGSAAASRRSSESVVKNNAISPIDVKPTISPNHFL